MLFQFSLNKLASSQLEIYKNKSKLYKKSSSKLASSELAPNFAT
jgi:hypothetical protein